MKRPPRRPVSGGRTVRRRCPLGAGGGPLSADEVGERGAQGVGHEEQVREGWRTLRGFPAVDGLVVAADAFTKLDLGEAGLSAAGADAFPDFPAAGVYPVGHGVEWHPTTVERSWFGVFTQVGKSWDLGNPADICNYHRPELNRV